MAKKASGPTKPTPPQKPTEPFWLRVRKWAEANWRQLLVWAGGWLTGQALPFLDQYLSKLLPVPGDLQLKANVFAVALTLAVVVITGVVAAATIHFITGHWRRVALVALFLFWFALALVFQAAFFHAEAKWKEKEADINYYYYSLEPLAYAACFAAFAGFLTTVGLVGMDLLHPFSPKYRRRVKKEPPATNPQ